VVVKVRAKAGEGEVRFFGDDAAPVDTLVENAAAGLRVHVSRSAEIDALKARLEKASSQRGGEVLLIASLGGGTEVEIKLPGAYALDAALRGALKTAPGVAFLEDV
jgi:DNA polymerase-3 subunit alpha